MQAGQLQTFKKRLGKELVHRPFEWRTNFMVHVIPVRRPIAIATLTLLKLRELSRAGGLTYACEKSQLLMHDAPDRSPPPLLRRQAPQTLGALTRSCQLLISAHLRCLFVFG